MEIRTGRASRPDIGGTEASGGGLERFISSTSSSQCLSLANMLRVNALARFALPRRNKPHDDIPPRE